MSWPKPLAAVALAGLVAACGVSPEVKSTANYRPETFEDRPVVLLPIAVSDPLGDERTGVVLSDGTRQHASEVACKAAQEEHRAGRISCPDQVARSSDALQRVERSFALDEPIKREDLAELSALSGAEYALLFRPEGVHSTRKVTRSERYDAFGAGAGPPGVALATSALLTGMTLRKVTRTKNGTQVTYVLSASLIELKTGKLLKVGLHSGVAGRTVKRNLGYGEGPPMSPLLQEILVELTDAVLEE
jgi:hypothetical protein